MAEIPEGILDQTRARKLRRALENLIREARRSLYWMRMDTREGIEQLKLLSDGELEAVVVASTGVVLTEGQARELRSFIDEPEWLAMIQAIEMAEDALDEDALDVARPTSLAVREGLENVVRLDFALASGAVLHG